MTDCPLQCQNWRNRKVVLPMSHTINRAPSLHRTITMHEPFVQDEGALKMMLLIYDLSDVVTAPCLSWNVRCFKSWHQLQFSETRTSSSYISPWRFWHGTFSLFYTGLNPICLITPNLPLKVAFWPREQFWTWVHKSRPDYWNGATSNEAGLESLYFWLLPFSSCPLFTFVQFSRCQEGGYRLAWKLSLFPLPFSTFFSVVIFFCSKRTFQFSDEPRGWADCSVPRRVVCVFRESGVWTSKVWRKKNLCENWRSRVRLIAKVQRNVESCQGKGI